MKKGVCECLYRLKTMRPTHRAIRFHPQGTCGHGHVSYLTYLTLLQRGKKMGDKNKERNGEEKHAKEWEMRL